jgi:dynein heavy chain 1, cytosolic
MNLLKVATFWKEYNLELTSYQSKTKIVKGWDDLFNKLKEHIQSLTSMRMSPYYKVMFLYC